MRPLFVALLVGLWVVPAVGQSGEQTAEQIEPNSETRIDALVVAVTENDSFKVRLQAAVYLGRSNDEKAIKPLIHALSNDPHYTLRAAAATALANLGTPLAIPHILRRVAVDPDSFVREEADRALGKYSRDEALPYVVATYNSDDPRVRKRAVTYLAAEPTPAAEPVLARALGDLPDIFEIARDTILKMKAARAIKFLSRALNHREAPIRRGAVQSLHAMEQVEATRLIWGVYERDIEVDEVRHAARVALRQLRRFLPLDKIVQGALSHPEKHARAKALKLLGVVGGDKAEEVLKKALHDDDIYVRGNAVMAMRELDDPSVIPSLEILVVDPANQRIVHLVRHTLKHLRRNRGEEANK